MIAIFALLIVIVACGFLGALITADSGEVSMIWKGYIIETNFGVLILLIIFSFLIVLAVYNTFKRLSRIPENIVNRRKIRNYDRGLAALTKSIAALAASDINSAERHNKSAEKFLGKSPITLMLQAQISKTSDNDQETRILLNQLLEYPETEYLAAKSLSEAASKQKLLPDALALAKRAYNLQPDNKEAALRLFSIYLDSEQFQEAEAHLIQAKKSRAFSRAEFRNYLGEMSLKQAKTELAAGRKENAIIFAKQAKKYLGKNAEISAIIAAKD